jgi:hypothetical protein
MIAYNWNHALGQGSFYSKASFMYPILAVGGIALIFIPNPAEERKARGEDISELSQWQLITPRWWVILVVGILAGIVNHYLLLTGAFIS